MKMTMLARAVLVTFLIPTEAFVAPGVGARALQQPYNLAAKPSSQARSVVRVLPTPQSHCRAPCLMIGIGGVGRTGLGRKVGKGLLAAAVATRIASPGRTACSSGDNPNGRDGRENEEGVARGEMGENQPNNDKVEEVDGVEGGVISRRTAVVGAAVAAIGLLGALAVRVLDTPSRPYNAEANTVGNEYDSWTEDGILESYWGEHIHLGYYSEEDRRKGAFRKSFIKAKYDFIDEMAKWGEISMDGQGEGDSPKAVLDVGCGVGGTSRYLAKKLGPDTTVTGITLSPKQVERATQLAEEQGVPNAKFQVTNALDMSFEDDSFDLVWACESGEHMPDKGKYIEEMTRVLKPGGRLVIATWCQRDNSTQPFTPVEEKKLNFLYSEWSHPHFISINDYGKLMEGTGQLEQVETADWAEQTTPTWRLSIWVGVVNPWPWLRVPRAYYKTVRDAWCIERMHQAFKTGLMQYGMMKAVKKIPSSIPSAEEVAEVAENVGAEEEHTEGFQDNEASEQQRMATEDVGEGGDEEPKAPIIIP